MSCIRAWRGGPLTVPALDSGRSAAVIVTGTSRAAPRLLARDLLQPKGDKRIEVLELPYPADLLELFVDWQLVSEIPRGLHGLYHVRICPAPGNPMTPAQWTRAPDILGEELALPEPHHRAAVLHHDGVRPNLHVVWQRTNIETWTLWNDSQNYPKHERASRRMELEFGHPPVQDKRAKARPTARPDDAPSASYPAAPKFNRDEGRQARRTGVRITAMKTQVAALKAAAESPQAFKTALEDVGYILAKGDSGYILIDPYGGVYSLVGQLKMKLARVNEFMAPLDLAALPTADQVKGRQYQLSLRQKGIP